MDCIENPILHTLWIWTYGHAHYNNGWFIGKIVYYNCKISKYKVVYDDMLTDFIYRGHIAVVKLNVLHLYIKSLCLKNNFVKLRYIFIIYFSFRCQKLVWRGGCEAQLVLNLFLFLRIWGRVFLQSWFLPKKSGRAKKCKYKKVKNAYNKISSA